MTKTNSHAESEQILRGRRRIVLLATAALGLSVFAVGRVAHAADVTITVDAGKQISGNPRFWATCVGTGTASLTLRPDLQTHYKIGNRELGFLRVRGHGLLNDDMGIYKGAGSYDWTKFDKYLAAIVAANMRPMIELSFMPTALAASGNDRNPPKDYSAWQKLIQAVVQHAVDKYGAEDVGKWYWEVWNEWNYSGFWTGNMEDYHKLYMYAVNGAIAALPDILIGGPVTTQGSTSQMTSFLSYAKTNNLRVSFLSSHAYPGGEGPSADASFGVSDNDGRVKVITSAGYTTDKMPSFNTEWNTAYTGQGGNTTANNVSMDNHVNAPFILKSVKLLADQVKGDKPPLDVFSYWVISDVFGEYGSDAGSYILNKTPNGTLPFGSVFGMMTFQGIRKAAFNGFKMLNYLGDKRLQVSGGAGTKDGVDGMATVSTDGNQVQIIVYNYYTTINQTGSDNVTVTVNNLPFAGKEAYITRFAIDEKNSNPYSVWAGQSKPSAPTEAQWQAMRKAQHMMPVEPVAKKALEGTYTATFSVPKQGAAMIILSLKRPLTGRDAKVEIEGEDYDGQSGITKEDSADESMGQAISAAANGWVYFENVDYSDEGVDTVQLRVKNAAETSVELRSESETGTSLGKCPLPASSTWATQTCKLSAPATGVSKLYLMFAGAARLNWLKFSGAGGNPTGGSGGNSGTSTGGAGGTSGAGGTGGGKGGTTGAGGTGGGGAAGGGGTKSGGTTGGAGQASAGSSSSSSQASGGDAGQSSSSRGGSSSSGGNGASSSSSGSGSKGGSSGQSSSARGSSSSAATGSSSGCGCRVGGTGGSPGAFSLFTLLFGVLVMRKRHACIRASRACIALLAAACSSGGGGGAGGQGGSDSSAGQSGSGGKSAQSSSGGSAGSSSSKSSGGSETGGKTENSSSSGTAGKGGSSGTGTGGTGGARTTGGTGGGTKSGTGGNGGDSGGGGTGPTAGSGGTSAAAGNGGTASGTAGKGGSAGTAGSTSNPPPTLSLVTTKAGAEWKTDGQLKEVTTNADVTVNDGSAQQDWEGFGAAFNEKGWNYLTMLSEEDRNKTLNLLFAADGANFAWGRIPIGATDYAMDRYTCNETKDDTSMSKFSIDRDKEKLIPFVKAAKAIKTDMRFWASPWTPPTWLKSGPFNTDSPYDGGKMKTDATSLKALADYFVKFVQAYDEQGIKIEIVSPQNEPGYSGTYPTCGWDPTAYASFVGKHLGPALSAASLSVKIMLGTFNGGTGDTNIVSTVMGDATAKPFIKVMGFQWGMDGSIASVKQYGVPVWQTEHKCGNYPWETYNKDKAPNDHAYAVESWGLIRDWIKKGVTSYSTWNVVLDTIGLGIDFERVWPQNALLTVDTSAKKLVITPTYYVFRHFSQFVKPGAKVVGTTGGDAVAFKNDDGSIVTVLYNKDAEKTMTVAAGGKKLQFTMPGNGWATVIAR